MRHSRRLLPGRLSALAFSAILVFSAILAATPCGRISASPDAAFPEDTASYIAARFPDRKTSAQDSERFLSYAEAQLQSAGWETEIQDYRVVVGVTSPTLLRSAFVNVAGQNLLAYAPGSEVKDDIDLLIVAPYDLLFAESTDALKISHTAQSSAILMDLATKHHDELLRASIYAGAGTNGSAGTSNSANIGNTCLAFVSGHYQYGAGAHALLTYLIEERGVNISAAIVIGDVAAMDSVILTTENNTPIGLVDAVYRGFQDSGLGVVLIGARERADWLRTNVGAGPGVAQSESILSQKDFGGEASVLAGLEVPALTVGLPTGNLASSRRDVSFGLADKISEALAKLEWTEIANPNPASNLSIAQSIPVQVGGSTSFVPKRTVFIWGFAAIGLGSAALALHFRSTRSFGNLLLVVGIVAALSAAHGIRKFFASWAPAAVWDAFPHRVLFIYFASAAALSTLGFLRVWSVRSRIFHLHRKAPGLPSPQSNPIFTNGWVGGWCLAVIMAAQLGGMLAASPTVLWNLASVVAMTAAVLLGLCRIEERAKIWIQRCLCLAALLPPFFWAGSPFSKDPARIYVASMSSLSVESVIATAISSAALAAFVSTFPFPAPAAPKQTRLFLPAGLAAVLALFAIGFLSPRIYAGLPSPTAVLRERYEQSSATMTVESSRPLGGIKLLSDSDASDRPDSSQTSLLETLRLPPATPSWAEIGHESGEGDGSAGRITGAIQAKFEAAPTFLSLVCQDMPIARSSTVPFSLRNLHQLLTLSGTARVLSSYVKPTARYSVETVWWMPNESSFPIPIDVTCTPLRSGVDITCNAVYLDRSYAGFRPSAGDARFFLMTEIAHTWILR